MKAKQPIGNIAGRFVFNTRHATGAATSIPDGMELGDSTIIKISYQKNAPT